jgi:GH18 family chitinase
MGILIAAAVAALGLLAWQAAFNWSHATAPEPAFRTVGYLPDYRVGRADPAVLGRDFTDIILFSIEPTAEGGIDARRLNARGYGIVRRLKQAGVHRVLVAVGGWDRSGHFASVCADPLLRRKFVAGLRDYCVKHGLDGVDYDWEFPRTAGQAADYARLLCETKEGLRPHGMLVTVAVVKNQTLSREALAAVDRVHLMAYDAPGQHATYDFAVDVAQTWLGRGAPASKLCLGLPFYGRSVRHPRRSMSYADVQRRYSPPPETDRLGTLYFNGITTLQRKTAYCRANGLCGVMVWEVGQDAPGGVLGRALNAAD